MNRTWKSIAVALGVGCIAIISFAFAGIIRHDVPMEEYIAFGKQPQFDCVGKVTLKDGEGAGSAVLIAERYVLTAAHILVTSDYRLDTHMIDGHEVIVNQPINERFTEPGQLVFHFKGETYPATRIIIHPRYTLERSPDATDMAIVELGTPVENVRPATLGATFDELGKIVAGCGFGWSAIANKPEELFESGMKIAGQNTIDSLGGYKVPGTDAWAIMFADFDHPDMPDSCNRIGSPIALPLEYIPAGGDSGSGLFVQDSAEWKLIGICSGESVNVDRLMKYGYYSQINGWTRVSVFHDWIQKTVNGR